MGEFDRQFKISASRNPDVLNNGSTLDLVTDFMPDMAGLVIRMKNDLDARHVTLDEARGPINKDGALSLIFASSDTPSVVVRLGQLDNPVDSAIVLKPAARFVYKAEGEGADVPEYQAHILPFAPDNGKVSKEDVINTLRVLKAEGLEGRIFDISEGQFVFLTGADGKTIRYPSDTGDDMAGKPIAFIRDLNCTQADPEVARKMAGTGTADDYLAQHGNGVTLASLPPAKASCVEACHQQDALTRRAQAELSARGVVLTGPSVG